MHIDDQLLFFLLEWGAKESGGCWIVQSVKPLKATVVVRLVYINKTD